MNANLVKFIKENELQLLEEFFSTHTYTRDASAIFQGHVPHVGFLVIDGEVRLKHKKGSEVLGKGAVVALKELYHELPCGFEVEVTNGTKVYVVDKSTLQDILSEGTESSPELVEIVQRFVA